MPTATKSSSARSAGRPPGTERAEVGPESAAEHLATARTVLADLLTEQATTGEQIRTAILDNDPATAVKIQHRADRELPLHVMAARVAVVRAQIADAHAQADGLQSEIDRLGALADTANARCTAAVNGTGEEYTTRRGQTLRRVDVLAVQHAKVDADAANQAVSRVAVHQRDLRQHARTLERQDLARVLAELNPTRFEAPIVRSLIHGRQPV